MSLEVKRSTVKNECWLHPGNKAHHINLSELERYQLGPPIAGDAAAPDIAVILVKSNQTSYFYDHEIGGSVMKTGY